MYGQWSLKTKISNFVAKRPNVGVRQKGANFGPKIKNFANIQLLQLTNTVQLPGSEKRKFQRSFAKKSEFWRWAKSCEFRIKNQLIQLSVKHRKIRAKSKASRFSVKQRRFAIKNLRIWEAKIGKLQISVNPDCRPYLQQYRVGGPKLTLH